MRAIARRTVFTVLLSLFGSAAIAQGAGPRSQNDLLNRLVALKDAQPAGASPSEMNAAIADMVLKASAKERAAMFSDLNSALQQISAETLQREADVRTAGAESSVWSGDFYSNLGDERLLIVAGVRPVQSYLGAVFAQLHVLSDAQFLKFAGEFIFMLEFTNTKLIQLNMLRTITGAHDPRSPLTFSFGSSMLLDAYADTVSVRRLAASRSQHDEQVFRSRVSTLLANVRRTTQVYRLHGAYIRALIKREAELNQPRHFGSVAAAETLRTCSDLFLATAL